MSNNTIACLETEIDRALYRVREGYIRTQMKELIAHKDYQAALKLQRKLNRLERQRVATEKELDALGWQSTYSSMDNVPPILPKNVIHDTRLLLTKEQRETLDALRAELTTKLFALEVSLDAREPSAKKDILAFRESLKAIE